MRFFILFGDDFQPRYFEYQWYETVCVECNHEDADRVHLMISAVNWFLKREKLILKNVAASRSQLFQSSAVWAFPGTLLLGVRLTEEEPCERGGAANAALR